MLPDLQVETPIRGKVRMGKKTNGRPQAVDHFRSTDTLFTEALGNPKEIIVRFPYSDPNECLRTSLEFWGGNQTLKCWCNDTQTANRRQKDGTWGQAHCKYKDCPQYTGGKNNGCGPVGRLRFTIPAVHPKYIYQLDTKSWNTISRCLGVLAQYSPIDPNQEFRLVIVQETSPVGRFNVAELRPIDLPTVDPSSEPEDTPDE